MTTMGGGASSSSAATSTTSTRQQRRPRNPYAGGSCFSLGTLRSALTGRGSAQSSRAVTADYEVSKEELGRGHYGVVFKGRSRATGKQVAIKRINKRSTEKKQMQMIEREVRCMQMINDSPHPNIVRMHDLYEDAKYFWLVMEMCGGGELFDAIVARGKFSERESRQIMHAILQSVGHMHSQGIVHRDLKPENILIDFSAEGATTSIKMIDFGLARPDSRPTLMQRPNLTRFKSRVGTPYYIAPEVIRKDYSTSCDEWSCGVILYILLCGFPPFNGATDADIFKRVKKGSFNFPDPEWRHISSSAKHLICKLLDKDPSKRITAQAALQHPFFAGVTPIAQKVDPADEVAAAALKQHQLVPVAEVEVEKLTMAKDHGGAGPAAVEKETDSSLTKSAMQAKVILERVSSQAMGTAWKAWTALHP